MTTPSKEAAIAQKIQSASSDSSQPAVSEPSFGWNQYAEQINGRFAMIGFVALLIKEFITQQDFFTWIGIR